MSDKDKNELTDEQIENWRKALSIDLGSYAFTMPKKEVQKIRNKMQELSDKPDFGEF